MAGVTGYEVQVNGVFHSYPATPTVSITGKTPNTQYSVRVRARDAVGNWSPFSTALTVTTSP